MRVVLQVQEGDALKQAGKECEGATLFVTLEPCAHEGQTPPCAQSIINSKISRVVCPLIDPDPRVSGKGFALLKHSNIVIDLIPHAHALAQETVEGFFSRIKRGRPYLTVKLGMSLDGKIASNRGKSQWITNNASRARSHLLRARNDAILIGTNTFLYDNPTLNIRGSFTNFSNPLRIFLDQGLKIFPSALILANIQKFPSVLVCGKKLNDNHLKIWKRNNVEILQIDTDSYGLNLTKLCEALAKKGINSLLVEGGGKIVRSLLLENLIDKLIIYKSGVILGSGGVPSFAELDSATQEISDYPNLKLQSISQSDNNLETIWKPV